MPPVSAARALDFEGLLAFETAFGSAFSDLRNKEKTMLDQYFFDQSSLARHLLLLTSCGSHMSACGYLSSELNQDFKLGLLPSGASNQA